MYVWFTRNFGSEQGHEDEKTMETFIQKHNYDTIGIAETHLCAVWVGLWWRVKWGKGSIESGLGSEPKGFRERSGHAMTSGSASKPARCCGVDHSDQRRWQTISANISAHVSVEELYATPLCAIQDRSRT